MANYRGIFPGTFTMGSVVCGFLAILSAFEGNITTACWLIVLAGFLDALDGKVARLSGGSSRFGIELDSLADFLSFGVAPAVILHTAKLGDLGRWGWIISVVYIMAAAYRLARFNLLAETEEKKDFVGLAVPMAAIALVSYVIFSFRVWGQLEHNEFLVTTVILLSMLMVSQIRYDSLPDHFESRQNRIKLIILIAVTPAVIYKPRLMLFPLVSAYILYGMVREFYRLFHMGVGKVTGRANRRLKTEKEPNDESE
jgi:CDP-diacylglycerol--serine O-phosphatidyltransferase